jgi:hypothetical protein
MGFGYQGQDPSTDVFFDEETKVWITNQFHLLLGTLNQQ